MRTPLFQKILDKSRSSIVAAIEVYNKPHFPYREESFALLAINAWELLLKARLLQINRNDIRTLYVREKRKKKDGNRGVKTYIKRNRSGNPMTIGLNASMNQLASEDEARIPLNVRRNVEGLIEIRDNAAHYINPSSMVTKEILEIATASIQNYVNLLYTWFNYDLSDDISLFLPLSFIQGTQQWHRIQASTNEKRLLQYLHGLASGSQNAPHGADDFHVAVRVEVRLERSKMEDAIKFAYSDDPNATKVVLSEEQIQERYPWDYNELIRRLRERYDDFKLDKTAHAIRKQLMNDERYARERLLHPRKPKGPKTVFYNPNILKEFDKHYTKR